MRLETARALGRDGYSIGVALAVAMSWGLHHSIWKALCHGLCGWFYVLIWALS